MGAPIWTAAAGLALGATGAAAQTIAYDTFGPGNAYNTASAFFVRGPNYAGTAPDWTQGWLFQAAASGGITELLLPLRHTGATNEFRLEIRLDDNQTPGARIGQFEGVMGGPTAESLVTIPGDGSIHLDAGQPYWIVLYAIGDGSGNWYQNNQSISLLRALSRNQGATWTYGNTNAPAFRLTVSTGPACYANCDGSTALPLLNVNDFVCFQTRFAAGEPYADCDQSGTLNVNDFVCFQTAFAAGCR